MTSPDPALDPSAALLEIRAIMRRQSQVLSLSGLSGVWAGVCALVAVALAYRTADVAPVSGIDYFSAWVAHFGSPQGLRRFVFVTGSVTLLLAIVGATYFTVRRLRASEQPLWSSTTRRLLIALVTPLLAGAMLVLAHWWHGDFGYSAALTLIFYGLALLGAGPLLLDEIRTLGYVEVALGLLVAFWPAYGVEAWAIGFGVCHVAYGTLMWWRYERRNPDPR